MSHRRLVAFWNRFTTNRQLISASRRRQQSVLQSALEPLQRRLLLSQTTLSGFASYTFDLGNSTNTVVETPTSGNATTLTLNLANSYAIGNSTNSSGGTISINTQGLTGPILVQPAQVALSADNFQLTFDSTFKTLNLSDELGNGTADPNAVVTADDPNDNDTIQINSTDVVWSGPTINFGAIPTLDVDALAGNQTIDYSGSSETVNLTGDSSTTYNLGNDTAGLSDITGPLSITGGTLNLSLAGTGAGTLSSTTLTGFGAGAPLTIGSGTALNLTLPNPNETLNITGLPGPTTSNEKGDTVSYVGNLSASGNNTLNVVGGSTGTLNIDDSSDTLIQNKSLSPTTFSGAGGNISYSGLRHLNVTVGAFNLMTVSNTAPDTATQVTDDASSGSGLLNLVDDSGPTTLNADSGNQIEIAATGCATSANLTGTNNSILLNGDFANYLQPITATGGNVSSTLFAIDSDNTGRTFNLAANHIGGAGMTTGGISYSGFSTVNLDGGDGNDTTNISSTAGNTTTTFDSGVGTNVVNLIGDSSTTFVTLNGASSLVNVRGINGNTTVNDREGGATIVNVGGANAGGGSLDTILDALTVDGGNNTFLHVDDTASTEFKDITLTGASITQNAGNVTEGVANQEINYSDVSLLKLWLGSGGDETNIEGTSANTTQIRSGYGNSTVNAYLTDGNTTIITNQGTNVVDVGPVPSEMPGLVIHPNTIVGTPLGNFTGTLSVVGTGNDTLIADDSGTNLNESGTLGSAAITGLSTSPIDYSGIANLKLWLGLGHDFLYDTGSSAATTNIHAQGPGSDVQISANTGNTTINVASGSGSQSALNVGVAPSGNSSLSQLGGNITGIGSSSDEFVVAGVSTGNGTASIGPATFSGLGIANPLSFLGFGGFASVIDSGGNALTMTGAYASTSYQFGGNNSTNTAAVDFAGDQPAAISFSNYGPVSINVQGNFTGNLTTSGTITSAHIGGNFASGAVITGQAGVGTVTVGGADLGTVNT